MVEDEFTSVDCWLAETELLVVCPPEVPPCVFTPTPGLTFTPALTSLFVAPTLAPTPTFGFTLVDVPPAAAAPGAAPADVDEDWFCVTPWFIVEDEFTSVDDWFAVTALLVVWLPGWPTAAPGCVFTFTPGLMFAPAFTSLLPMPTFAPTPTFGLTLVDVPPLEAEPVEGA
jgi:hypothetical protein